MPPNTCPKRGKWLFVAEQWSHYCSNWMVLSAKTGWNFSEWLFRMTPLLLGLQVDTSLSKVASRMYILFLRVCRSYGYTKENLNLLFETVIRSLFHNEIEVWGPALQNKYLQRIDKFFRRAHRFGYTLACSQTLYFLRQTTKN